MFELSNIAAIGAQYKTQETIFGSNATVQQMLGANPARVAVAFSDSAGNIFIGTDAGKVSTSFGAWQLTVNGPFLILTFAQLGPLVGSAWFSCRTAGISSTGITEVIYVPSG